MRDYRYFNIARSDEIALIKFINPPVNAMTFDALFELGEIMDEIENVGFIKGMIFTSGIEDIFVSGIDMKMLANMSLSSRNFKKNVRYVNRIFDRIEAIEKPTLVLLNGHALGVGLELALLFDFRFMSAGDYELGFPEIRFGFYPLFGGTVRLGRLIGRSRAQYMLMIGKSLRPDEAEFYGIVHMLCNKEMLLEEGIRFLKRMIQSAPIAYSSIKKSLNRTFDISRAEILAMELKHLNTLKNSSDFKEGIQAFLEKRKPKFTGR